MGYHDCWWVNASTEPTASQGCQERGDVVRFLGNKSSINPSQNGLPLMVLVALEELLVQCVGEKSIGAPPQKRNVGDNACSLYS